MTTNRDTTKDHSADVVTVLSGDLVASVMEEYFNTVMYNTQAMGTVKVVDLASQGDGFMFGLTFTRSEVSRASVHTWPNGDGIPIKQEPTTVLTPDEIALLNQQPVHIPHTNNRDKKGKYAKHS